MPIRLFAVALAALLALPAFADPPKKAPLLAQLDAEGSADVATSGRLVAGLHQRDGRVQRYGSALIVEDGLLLTTTGVIPKDAKNVTAYLPGPIKVTAKVVAIDQRQNLTLLSYSAPRAGEVAKARWADSDKVRTGQMVYTLGNPFGTIIQTQRVSASSGVISGRYTIRAGDRPYVGELIETTAAVNPGSFGGPVVDLQGRVVGIAHRGISYKRWLGTVIPSKVVQAFLARHKAGETKIEAPTAVPTTGARTPQAFLGVRTTNARMGMRMGRGVRQVPVLRVTAVKPDGPADKAGVKSGDILMMFGTVMVRNTQTLDRALAAAKPGQELTLTLVRRNGRQMQRIVVKVTLGSVPM